LEKSLVKLLLHTCCGPCFLGVWEELSAHKEIETTLYYFNPNIYPEEEYTKRLENLANISINKGVELVRAEYSPVVYDQAIGGGVDFPVRCLACYRLRLNEAAIYAKAHDFNAFSTTLLVSPYQNHEELQRIGKEIGAQVGVDFYYSDWRPHFREGQNIARQLGVYRQQYCGCKHSLKERNG
jgi:epoxyqueuosine reductase